MLYLWVPVNGQRPPAAVRHRLTCQRMANDSATVALSAWRVEFARYMEHDYRYGLYEESPT